MQVLAEFYDYLNLEYKGKALIEKESVSVEIDYIDQTTYKFNFLNSELIQNQIMGTICNITNTDNTYNIVGVVVAVNENQITLQEFINYLNFDYLEVTGTLETNPTTYIIDLFTNEYITNTDNLKNLTYLTIIDNTPTNNTIFNFDSTKQNTDQILTNIFSTHSIYTIYEFDRNNKQITITFEQSASNIIEIKNDITDFQVVIKIEKNDIDNKITFFEEVEDEVTKIVTPIKISPSYYLSLFGEVSDAIPDNERVTPVFEVLERINRDSEGNLPTNEQLLELAQKIKTNVFAHEINCYLKKKSKLLDINEFKAGTIIRIIDDRRIIETIVTGTTINAIDSNYTIKCGFVRSRLTSLLKQKGSI